MLCICLGKMLLHFNWHKTGSTIVTSSLFFPELDSFLGRPPKGEVMDFLQGALLNST